MSSPFVIGESEGTMHGESMHFVCAGRYLTGRPIVSLLASETSYLSDLIGCLVLVLQSREVNRGEFRVLEFVVIFKNNLYPRILPGQI
jgi:hypothetical protein